MGAVGGRGRWRNLILVRNAHRLRAGSPKWDSRDAAGTATLEQQKGLLNAADVGRNGQGCLLRAAMDGLQDAK